MKNFFGFLVFPFYSRPMYIFVKSSKKFFIWCLIKRCRSSTTKKKKKLHEIYKKVVWGWEKENMENGKAGKMGENY